MVYRDEMYTIINYLSMLGLKLNHFSKSGPWGNVVTNDTLICNQFVLD